ncbi:NTP/NDP exchange transporter [Crateriforma conspicua]|nr:MFS transporter [Crateriforma conspicua]
MTSRDSQSETTPPAQGATPQTGGMMGPWRSRIHVGEGASVAWATTWFFFILHSYSIVRPLRETMGAIVGPNGLQGLMLITFGVMLVAVPAYAALVARLPRRWVVRIVFHFFCVCLLLFAIGLQSSSETLRSWTAWVFFIWVNVFALVATSVFWSVLADLFSNRQGKRLFGMIAAGGTVGAITGSLLTSQLAASTSTSLILLLPLAAIQCGLWCAWRLEKQTDRLHRSDPDREQHRDDGRPTGGGLLTGIARVLSSGYLASICGFLVLIQAGGTMLYFQQAEIVAQQVADDGQKTQLFAYIDLGTQTLTLLLQIVFAGPILRRLGVSVALVLLPLVYGLGFSALAVSQTLPILVVTMIACRSTAYGIAVPAREVLFTVVSREDKYKSKNFIDTVVLRGGDALTGQIFGSLRNFAGLGLATLNICAIPIAIGWGVLAWNLGRQQRRLAQQANASGGDVSAPDDKESR